MTTIHLSPAVDLVLENNNRALFDTPGGQIRLTPGETKALIEWATSQPAPLPEPGDEIERGLAGYIFVGRFNDLMQITSEQPESFFYMKDEDLFIVQDTDGEVVVAYRDRDGDWVKA